MVYSGSAIGEVISIILFLLTVAFISGVVEANLESWKRNKEIRAIQKRLAQINKQREKLRKLVNAK